jgi:hypothetical protein
MPEKITFCPECEALIPVNDPREGATIKCHKCDAELEIIATGPWVQESHSKKGFGEWLVLPQTELTKSPLDAPPRPAPSLDAPPRPGGRKAPSVETLDITLEPEPEPEPESEPDRLSASTIAGVTVIVSALLAALEDDFLPALERFFSDKILPILPEIVGLFCVCFSLLVLLVKLWQGIRAIVHK